MKTKDDLIKMQSVPLEVKILMTQRRIREWVSEFGVDGVYVSFSGGKDSTVHHRLYICCFGAHLEKGKGRFERLKQTHPKQYDYCMNGGSYDSDGIWKPDKNGLGMKHVIDTLNSLYGEDFIKY